MTLAFKTAFLANSVEVAATANKGWPKYSTFVFGNIGSPSNTGPTSFRPGISL